MTALFTFGHGKSGTQTRLFLACLYCQKQLETKVLIKNSIILILKSVLKEYCIEKQRSSFKAKHICLD